MAVVEEKVHKIQICHFIVMNPEDFDERGGRFFFGVTWNPMRYIVEGGGTTNAFEIFDISKVRLSARF